MLRLCANLGFLFPEVPFLDRFAAAARAGFTGVEYASPYEYPVAELKSRLADNGLTQVLINTWPGNRAAGERGFACVPGKVGAFRDSIGQALEYAKALGCQGIHVISGVLPEDVARDTAAALYANNLAWAGERALAAGVRLTIEPLNPATHRAISCRRRSRARRSSRRSGVTASGCSSTPTTARSHRAIWRHGSPG